MLHSALVGLVVLFAGVHVALAHGLSVDNLFALLLIVDLREVLGELVVQGRAESNYRFRAEMADVDADEHGVLVG